MGTAVAIQGIPADKFGKLAKTLRGIDWGQNTMMIGRAVLDVPELTRQGGQGWHVDWSEGMYNHGITSRNTCELLSGLFGFGGHLVPLRGEGAATRRIVIVAQDDQRTLDLSFTASIGRSVTLTSALAPGPKQSSMHSRTPSASNAGLILRNGLI